MFRKRRDVPTAPEDRGKQAISVDVAADLDDEVARLTAELNSVNGELAEVRRHLADAEENRRAALRDVVTEISAVVEEMESEFERALAGLTHGATTDDATTEGEQERTADSGD